MERSQAMDHNEETRLLRVEEVGRFLGVSRSQAYALLGSGEMPCVRLGRRCVRIPLDALRRWIADRMNADEPVIHRVKHQK